MDDGVYCWLDRLYIARFLAFKCMIVLHCICFVSLILQPVDSFVFFVLFPVFFSFFVACALGRTDTSFAGQLTPARLKSKVRWLNEQCSLLLWSNRGLRTKNTMQLIYLMPEATAFLFCASANRRVSDAAIASFCLFVFLVLLCVQCVAYS